MDPVNMPAKFEVGALWKLEIRPALL